MMRNRIITQLAGAALVAASACSSEAPLAPGFQPGPDGGMVDAGPGPNPGPDAGMPMDGLVGISGQALQLGSYLRGLRVPVGSAQISALGVVGVDPVTAAFDGTYGLRVPQNGNLILSANAPNFLASHEEVAVAAYDLEGKDFIMASISYLDRIAAAYNVAYRETFACHAPNLGQQCKYAVVVGRVVDDGSEGNGTPTPIGGINVDEFTVVVDGYADWYTKGPYVLSALGAAQPGETLTQRARNPSNQAQYLGGLFIYYVEVPLQGPQSRSFEIRVSSAAGGVQNRYFGPSTDLAFRDGFTWVTVPETGLAPPPPPVPDDPPPPPVNVSFTNQVYPLFLTIDQGGYGCLGCHTSEGGQQPAGGLDLYGGPAAAFDALNPQQYPNRVNVANPRQSQVLSKPLYEPDGNQDHPIFAFLSEQDAGYLTLYGWIQGGAIDDTVDVLPPLISFYNDVRPILYEPFPVGAGCYNCHVDGVDENNAPGGAYFGGDGNALHQVLTQDTPTDNGLTGEPYRVNVQNAGQSLLLLNPTLGALEPHPQKLFDGVNDLRYQTIYQWIVEGAANDSPP